MGTVEDPLGGLAFKDKSKNVVGRVKQLVRWFFSGIAINVSSLPIDK